MKKYIAILMSCIMLLSQGVMTFAANESVEH